MVEDKEGITAMLTSAQIYEEAISAIPKLHKASTRLIRFQMT